MIATNYLTGYSLRSSMNPVAFKDNVKAEIESGGGADFKSALRGQIQQLELKVLRGETTPKFAIGGQEFSNDEWKKLINRVDNAIDSKDNSSIVDYLKDEKKQCPYSGLAKDGIIEYNGVIFTCDYDHNALCLGSMAEGEDIISVNLPSGGTLMINADNIDQISRCAGMFTPEDLNAILRAIHEHEHTKNADFKTEDDSKRHAIELMGAV